MVRVSVASLLLLAWTSVPRADVVRLAELRAGDQAPSFSLPGSDGRAYRLADYRGKQVVVLAWFAKAFTSG